MALSARNQLVGTIKSVTTDKIMAEVVVSLEGGQEMVSVITADSVQRLQLTVGKQVKVIIKSTEVMLSTE